MLSLFFVCFYDESDFCRSVIFSRAVSTSFELAFPPTIIAMKTPTIGTIILKVRFIFPLEFILSKTGGIKNAPEIRNKRLEIIDIVSDKSPNKTHPIPKIHFNTVFINLVLLR